MKIVFILTYKNTKIISYANTKWLSTFWFIALFFNRTNHSGNMAFGQNFTQLQWVCCNGGVCTPRSLTTRSCTIGGNCFPWWLDNEDVDLSTYNHVCYITCMITTSFYNNWYSCGRIENWFWKWKLMNKPTMIYFHNSI